MFILKPYVFNIGLFLYIVTMPIQTLEQSKEKHFPKDWHSQILDEYEVGASDVEIKCIIARWRGKFSNNLWVRWMKDEEEFEELINMGKLLSEGWWMKNGRTNLKDRDFNYTGWYMNMKNRFGWKDKTENVNDTKVSGDAKISINFED